jgi:hypothetical protein
MKKCAFCPRPVNEDDEFEYREVSSWVNGPKLDGPKLREQTGRVAHYDCVMNLVHGQAPDQGGLFELGEEKPAPRCEAQAVKGTGTGICDTPLTPQGDCVNGDNHVF